MFQKDIMMKDCVLCDRLAPIKNKYENYTLLASYVNVLGYCEFASHIIGNTKAKLQKKDR